MAELVKSVNGLSWGSMLSRNGLARASIKSLNGVDTTPAGGGTSYITGISSLGSLRNDYGLGVGIYFTVGASDMEVTHLGRWVVAGNSGTHVVTIYDGTTAPGDAIGNVTVDTSGATPGEFIYEALGSPISLLSGNTYYLLSVESVSGDQWYTDSGTVLTTTADATLLGAAYDAGGTINPIPGAGAYGFPSLLYTLTP